MRKLFLFAALLFAFTTSAQEAGYASTTAVALGGLNSDGLLEPSYACTVSKPFSYTAGGAGTWQVITPAASKKIYICGLMFATSQATTVNFVESPAGGCDGPDVTGAVAYPASSGLVLSTTQYAVPFTNTAGSGLCVKAGGATRVSGWIVYSQR